MKPLLAFFLLAFWGANLRAQTPAAPGPILPGNANPVTTAPGQKASNTPEITGYSFNPLAIKRDPFLPPTMDAGKLVKEIQAYDINEMNLVAVLTGFGKPQAMIALPSGRTEIVSEGDLIGRRNGRVAKITPNEIQIKESFKDYQNRMKTDITSLVIAD